MGWEKPSAPGLVVDGTAGPSLVPVAQADGSIIWAAASGLAAGAVQVGPVVYNANPGELVLCDPTAGTVTIVLPETPADGTVVEAKDIIGILGGVNFSVQGSDSFCDADGDLAGGLVAGGAAALQYDAALAQWLFLSDLYKHAPTSLMATPADPAGVAAAVARMQGLAIEVTPAASGLLHVTLGGTLFNPTAGGGAVVSILYGSGAAPANGDALTGTAIGNPQKSTVAAGKVPFSLTGLVAAPIGAATWIDAAVAYVTAGTGTIEKLTATVLEL